MQYLRITACFFSFLSLFLLITALASDYWIAAIDSSNSGLWKDCDFSMCIEYGMNVKAFIHATRAFLLMGMVAGAVSFFALCASFSHAHIGSISIKHLAVSASFVAGVCSMIAMSTFTGKYRVKPSLAWIGWSFGIGWASFPLFLITGVLACMTPSSPTETRTSGWSLFLNCLGRFQLHSGRKKKGSTPTV
ncbi:protein NKG7-like [Heteronotia binoei]|uniref:protein NKG7-like n=1 Tax=Heteronotia binoei TaxID=13085 RepID=UPI002930F84A|nr:protein NKG7-like [Heteronotia binoei]